MFVQSLLVYLYNPAYGFFFNLLLGNISSISVLIKYSPIQEMWGDIICKTTKEYFKTHDAHTILASKNDTYTFMMGQ